MDSVKLKKIYDSIGLMQKNLECSVCLELLQDPVSTKCDHQFCNFCALAVLQNSRKSSAPCPLCKIPITKRSLTKNEQLNRIVSAVRSVISAVEEDTGQKCSPPRGPVLISQPDPKPRRPSPVKKAKGQRKARNVRQTKRKTAETVVNIYEDESALSDAEEIELPVVGHTNVSSSFPRLMVDGKKGKHFDEEDRDLEREAEEFLDVLNATPVINNTTVPPDHSRTQDDVEQRNRKNLQSTNASRKWERNQNSEKEGQNPGSKVVENDPACLPDSEIFEKPAPPQVTGKENLPKESETDPYEFVPSQRTPRKAAKKGQGQRKKNKAGSKALLVRNKGVPFSGKAKRSPENQKNDSSKNASDAPRENSRSPPNLSKDNERQILEANSVPVSSDHVDNTAKASKAKEVPDSENQGANLGNVSTTGIANVEMSEVNADDDVVLLDTQLSNQSGKEVVHAQVDKFVTGEKVGCGNQTVRGKEGDQSATRDKTKHPLPFTPVVVIKRNSTRSSGGPPQDSQSSDGQPMMDSQPVTINKNHGQRVFATCYGKARKGLDKSPPLDPQERVLDWLVNKSPESDGSDTESGGELPNQEDDREGEDAEMQDQNQLPEIFSITSVAQENQKTSDIPDERKKGHVNENQSTDKLRSRQQDTGIKEIVLTENKRRKTRSFSSKLSPKQDNEGREKLRDSVGSPKVKDINNETVENLNIRRYSSRHSLEKSNVRTDVKETSGKDSLLQSSLEAVGEKKSKGQRTAKQQMKDNLTETVQVDKKMDMEETCDKEDSVLHSSSEVVPDKHSTRNKSAKRRMMDNLVDAQKEAETAAIKSDWELALELARQFGTEPEHLKDHSGNERGRGLRRRKGKLAMEPLAEPQPKRRTRRGVQECQSKGEMETSIPNESVNIDSFETQKVDIADVELCKRGSRDRSRSRKGRSVSPRVNIPSNDGKTENGEFKQFSVRDKLAVKAVTEIPETPVDQVKIDDHSEKVTVGPDPRLQETVLDVDKEGNTPKDVIRQLTPGSTPGSKHSQSSTRRSKRGKPADSKYDSHLKSDVMKGVHHTANGATDENSKSNETPSKRKENSGVTVKGLRDKGQVQGTEIAEGRNGAPESLPLFTEDVGHDVKSAKECNEHITVTSIDVGHAASSEISEGVVSASKHVPECAGSDTTESIEIIISSDAYEEPESSLQDSSRTPAKIDPERDGDSAEKDVKGKSRKSRKSSQKTPVKHDSVPSLDVEMAIMDNILPSSEVLSDTPTSRRGPVVADDVDMVIESSHKADAEQMEKEPGGTFEHDKDMPIGDISQQSKEDVLILEASQKSKGGSQSSGPIIISSQVKVSESFPASLDSCSQPSESLLKIVARPKVGSPIVRLNQKLPLPEGKNESDKQSFVSNNGVLEDKLDSHGHDQEKISPGSAEKKPATRMSRKKRKTFTLGIPKPVHSREASDETEKSCSTDSPSKTAVDERKQQAGQSTEMIEDVKHGDAKDSTRNDADDDYCEEQSKENNNVNQNPVEGLSSSAKSESQDEPPQRTLRSRSRGSQERKSAGPSIRKVFSTAKDLDESPGLPRKGPISTRSRSLPLTAKESGKGRKQNMDDSVPERACSVSQDFVSEDATSSSLKIRRKSKRQSQQSPANRKQARESVVEEVVSMDSTPVRSLDDANREGDQRAVVGSIVPTTPGASEAITSANIIPVRSLRSSFIVKDEENIHKHQETRGQVKAFEPDNQETNITSPRKLRRSSRRSKTEGISGESTKVQQALKGEDLNGSVADQISVANPDYEEPNQKVAKDNQITATSPAHGEPSVTLIGESAVTSGSNKEESQESDLSFVSLPDIFIIHEESRDMFDDGDEQETKSREVLATQIKQETVDKISENGAQRGGASYSAKAHEEVVCGHDERKEKIMPSSTFQTNVRQTSQKSQRDEDTEALIPPTPPCQDMSKSFSSVTGALAQPNSSPKNGTLAQKLRNSVQLKRSPKVGKTTRESKDSASIVASFLAPRRDSTPGSVGDDTAHGESLVMETPALHSRKKPRASDEIMRDTIVAETPAANLGKRITGNPPKISSSFPDTCAGFPEIGDSFPEKVSPTPEDLAETPATKKPVSVHQDLHHSRTKPSLSGKKVTSQTVAETPVEAITGKYSYESEEAVEEVQCPRNMVKADDSSSGDSEDDEAIMRKGSKRSKHVARIHEDESNDDSEDDDNAGSMQKTKSEGFDHVAGNDSDSEGEVLISRKKPKRSQPLALVAEGDSSDDDNVCEKRAKKTDPIAKLAEDDGDERKDDDVIGSWKTKRFQAQSTGDDSDDSEHQSEDDEPIGRRKRKRASRMTGVAEDEENESDDELIPCSFLQKRTEEPLAEEDVPVNADGDSMSSQESCASHHLNLTSASSVLSSQSEIMNTQQRDMARERLLNLEAQMLELQAVLGSEGGNKSQEESLEDEEDEDIASNHHRKMQSDRMRHQQGDAADTSGNGNHVFDVVEEDEANDEPSSPAASDTEPRSPSPPPSLSPRSLKKATMSSLSDSINTMSRMVEDIRKNSSKKGSQSRKRAFSRSPDDIIKGSPDMVSGNRALVGSSPTTLRKTPTANGKSPAPVNRSHPPSVSGKVVRRSAAYVSDSDSDDDNMEAVPTKTFVPAGRQWDKEKRKSQTSEIRTDKREAERRRSAKRRIEEDEKNNDVSESEEQEVSPRSRTVASAQSKRMKLSNDSAHAWTSPQQRTTPHHNGNRRGTSASHAKSPAGQSAGAVTPKSRLPAQDLKSRTPRSDSLQRFSSGQGASSMSSPVDVSMRTQRTNSEAVASPNQGSTGRSRVPSGPGASPSSTRSTSLIATGLNRLELRQVEQLSSRLANCRFASAFNANTTHVIVKTDSNFVCERTLKYFQGIAARAWIVSFQWIQDCLKAGKLLPERAYEVKGDVVNGTDHHGPERSRTWKGPGFLANYDLCCIGPFTGLNKDQLVGLCEMCGASTVQHPSLFPYTRGRSAFIVVEPNLGDNERDYEGLHRKYRIPVISREWILDSVAQYWMQPIADYLLSDYSPEDKDEPIIDIDSDEDE